MLVLSLDSASALVPVAYLLKTLKAGRIRLLKGRLVIPFCEDKAVEVDERLLIILPTVPAAEFAVDFDMDSGLLAVKTRRPSLHSSPDFLRVPGVQALVTEHIPLTTGTHVLIQEDENQVLFIGHRRPLARLAKFLDNPHACIPLSELPPVPFRDLALEVSVA